MTNNTLPVPVRDRPSPACRLVSWVPWAKSNSSLVGHCDVTFQGGWRINSVPIFRSNSGGFSAGGPSAPLLDREGRIRTDASGKKLYAPILQFDDAAARERWSRAVLGALTEAGIDPDRSSQPSLPL